MEIWKEGLQEYCVVKSVENSYFLEVEYQMLQCNRPVGILPVQLREQDGEKTLLYDISGGKNLCEEAGNTGMSEQNCHRFLKSIYQLLENLEETLLDIQHVSFLPENIYQKEEDHYSFMYLPDKCGEIQEEVKGLFEWLLAHIDYGESKTVQLVYHAYWCVRNQGFSRRMIEECLTFGGQTVTEYRSMGYEEYFHDKESIEENPVTPAEEAGELSRSQDMEKNSRAWTILMIILGVIAAGGTICIFIFVWLCMRYGLDDRTGKCLLGTAIGTLLAADGSWQAARRRKPHGQERSSDTEYMRQRHSYHADWDEGETTLLSQGEDTTPTLLSLETGEHIRITAMPFYIGSRRGGNQLVIADKTVSRQHAVLVQGDRCGCVLRDLQSTNGTFVNGKRVDSEEGVPLQVGDVLCFADREYRYLKEESYG